MSSLLCDWMDRFLARQLARPTGWFGRFFMGNKLNRVNEGMNSLTLRQLPLQKGARVLEIGFGGGALLRRLLDSEASLRVTGTELSEPMRASALRRFSREIASGRLEIVDGVIERLPFADRSFSRLYTVNTLYFWTDPEVAMQECARVLDAGGVAVVCYNDREEMLKWPPHRHGFQLYETHEVEALFRLADLTGVQTTSEQDPLQGRIHVTVGMKPVAPPID